MIFSFFIFIYDQKVITCYKLIIELMILIFGVNNSLSLAKLLNENFVVTRFGEVKRNKETQMAL